jgi:hypothetical protein
MPGPSILMHAAAWAQAAPAIALAGSKRSRETGRRLAALACLASVAGDGLNFFLSRKGINNLWVGYLSTPLSSTLIFMALSSWQLTPRARRAMMLLIPAYLAVWAAAIYFAEDLQRFSLVAFPAHYVILLACSLWTLGVTALGDSRDHMLRTDAFWIAGGFALWAGTAAAVEPLLEIFIRRDRVPEAVAVLNFKAGLQLLALIAITVGMLCPVTTVPSGPSSSPAR